ncbi:MAG: hypothetical protein WC356_01320 [Candidatus Micrarchaeia archaeon]|jgi:hypothetical protein
MKKGFLFSLSISLLFLILISFSSYIQKESLNDISVLNNMVAGKKVLYVFEDISEEITLESFDLEIIQNETNLTIKDKLPAEFDILGNLEESAEFIEENYNTSDIEILFLNTQGDEFSFGDLDPWITVEPWNIKYEYEDWGKRVLILSCPTQNCSKITKYILNITTNNVFDYAPIPQNKNDYKWAPDHLRNSCSGQTNCMEFELYITDGIGQVYSCPGPVCNDGAYDLTKTSSLRIKSSPCWIYIQLGGTAWDRDNYRVYEIRSHAPNNPNLECEIDFDLENKIEFESYDYTINLPLRLKVKEVNYNISKEGDIQKIE